MDEKVLIEKAISMLSYSYAPYSGYFVGAALLMNLTPNLQMCLLWLNRLQGSMDGKSFLKSVQERLNVLETD